MAGAVSFYSWFCSRFERFLGKLRILHFRLLGVKIGRGCHIERGVIIRGAVEIGDRTNIGAYSYLSTALGGRLVIGNDCHVGKLNQLGSGGSVVSIGDHCIFAAYVQVTDAIHEFRNRELCIIKAPVLASSVSIAPNVWLGSGVMVMTGVAIGEGAVIGAQSLVRASVPPFAIAVGTPARVVSYRE